MRILVVLPLFIVAVSGTVTSTVAIFCQSVSFPKYAEFNSKVSEYFFRNFGIGGIAYLNSIFKNGRGCIEVPKLERCGKKTFNKIANEMNRIVAVYNPSWHDSSYWSWDRKSIDAARYSIHRFIGLIESISVKIDSEKHVSTMNCLEPKYEVNFLKAFPKERRRQLSLSLEKFKQSMQKFHFSETIVTNALIVIGGDSRWVDLVDSKGLDLVNSVISLCDKLRDEAGKVVCGWLQELVRKAAEKLSKDRIKDSSYRVWFLWQQAKGSSTPYQVLMKFKRFPDEISGTCPAEEKSKFIAAVERAIMQIIRTVLLDDDKNFADKIGYSNFEKCEYISGETLYSLLQQTGCVTRTCDNFSEITDRLDTALKKLTQS